LSLLFAIIKTKTDFIQFLVAALKQQTSKFYSQINAQKIAITFILVSGLMQNSFCV